MLMLSECELWHEGGHVMGVSVNVMHALGGHYMGCHAALVCNTLYRGQGVVVDVPGSHKRAAAYAELQDVFRAQLGLAEVEGRLNLSGAVQIIIAVDATGSWLRGVRGGDAKSRNQRKDGAVR